MEMYHKEWQEAICIFMQKGKIFSFGMGESFFLNGIITTRNRAVLLSAIFLKTFSSHDKQTFLVCWLTSLRLMGVFLLHTHN